MTNPYFLFVISFVTMLSVILLYGQSQYAHAQDRLDILNLLISPNKIKGFTVVDNGVFFFESDPASGVREGFQPDTKLRRISPDGTVDDLAKASFVSPRGIFAWRDDIYLVTLAGSCRGSNTCNLGDVVRVHRGEAEPLATELALKIILAFDGDYIYITEGNAKIWRMKSDGSERSLIAEDNGIPADMQVAGDYLYYMFEGEGSSIRRIQKDGKGGIETLASSLLSPHDLRVYDDSIYWIEDLEEEAVGSMDYEVVRRISLNEVGRVEDVWRILSLRVFEDGAILSGDTEISRDFIYNLNVKEFPSKLVMRSIHNGKVQELMDIDFIVLDMIFENNSLYILGYNGNYGVWKVDLSAVIPEFSAISVVVFVAMLTAVLVWKIAQKPRTAWLLL